MAMHYYTKQLPVMTNRLVCNGCGATMAFYRFPAILSYGI